jgi:hypothetical protein
METTTNPEANMTLAERIDYHYTALKMIDRATPGRTPWQTLRKRAEEIAGSENLTEADRVA